MTLCMRCQQPVDPGLQGVFCRACLERAGKLTPPAPTIHSLWLIGAAALEAEGLQPGWRLQMEFDLRGVLMIIGQLQIALRNPENNGPMVDSVRTMVAQLIQTLDLEVGPATAELAREWGTAADLHGKPEQGPHQ